MGSVTPRRPAVDSTTPRYLYLGDAHTDPALRNRRCDPVRRADGRCIVSQRFATALVLFEHERRPRVVMRRRLRVIGKGAGRDVA